MDTETKKEFAKLNKQFGKVNNEFVKVHDEFTKVHHRIDKVDKRVDKVIAFLQKYMPTRAEIDARFENVATKNDINNIMTKIDGLAKMMKDNSETTQIVEGKLFYHEKWIRLAAPKIGIEFEG